ncbi:hypothetical protein DQ353_17365 [Arthrobacter sp. AQ5-05]|uniref:hypothetical protein n=1 Tax=Arthrobacter sp. AQ5-05 TaxID=2184581 RepID=UPI000DCCA743|nr:hypothetical protein [Arthrobacter sp. AQ5-05]RAX48051.1 hypothetical protein DQ353_17365 [Arthrobacter sp. AQ5-05]
MQPIDCHECGTAVLVEKFSVPHTSIQWLGDSTSACPRIAQANANGEGGLCGTTGLSCSSLRDTIDEAVRQGRIEIDGRMEPVIGQLG